MLHYFTYNWFIDWLSFLESSFMLYVWDHFTEVKLAAKLELNLAYVSIYMFFYILILQTCET